MYETPTNRQRSGCHRRAHCRHHNPGGTDDGTKERDRRHCAGGHQPARRTGRTQRPRRADAVDLTIFGNTDAVTYLDDITVSAVPEPASWALYFAGLLGCGMLVRWRAGAAPVSSK